MEQYAGIIIDRMRVEFEINQPGCLSCFGILSAEVNRRTYRNLNTVLHAGRIRKSLSADSDRKRDSVTRKLRFHAAQYNGQCYPLKFLAPSEGFEENPQI
jgi:hypothetical protein